MADPLKLVFEVIVISKEMLSDGNVAVMLESSYFYPTSGGQAHDTGTIGSAQVLDVFKNESGSTVIHILDSDIPLGPSLARIDPDRRMRHMQHHSGQHLLSQCCHRLLDLETLSAHIGGQTPSHIDLPDVPISPIELKEVETLANKIIYENRVIKNYIVASENIHNLPLRRPPKVSGAVRVIEIDGFDYSACGGTHCLQTGTIGILKILKLERQNHKARVYFSVGHHALDIFYKDHEIVTQLANQLSVHTEDVIDTVQHQTEQLKSTKNSLQKLQRDLIIFEARELAVQAKTIAAQHIVLRLFKSRPIGELRILAGELKEMSHLIALLATHDGSKISMLATCAADTNISAQKLLNDHLSIIGGRGGGDDQIAQGGGMANDEQAADIFAEAQTIIEKLLNAA
jgi:alanyl-tRNA synthetase